MYRSGDITPQPPVVQQEADNKEPEYCFEEVLVDNMLGNKLIIIY